MRPVPPGYPTTSPATARQSFALHDPVLLPDQDLRVIAAKSHATQPSCTGPRGPFAPIPVPTASLITRPARPSHASMTRKGNASAASGSAYIRDSNSAPRTEAPPTARIPQVRRSSRYISTMTAVHEGPNEGMGLRPTKEDSSESDPKGLEDQMVEAEAGVQSAIIDLARMERRLMREVKKRKLEVQESDLAVRRDNREEHAFKPRPTKNVDNSMVDSRPRGRNDLPAPERGTVEGEHEDAGGTDGDHGAADGPAGTAEAVERGAARTPPVDSNHLPLPWKGRLGYACLNTYLRNAKPPVFSSRTCRMSSIIDHRHPLQDPSMPEHTTKNRPDRTKKADAALGRKYLQGIGLANARDAVKMLRWNEKYGIRFMRLSSDMFPFASHKEHGYSLASFASEALAEVGAVAAELGHRLTMHPGQYTQLGSPREEVVVASVRDLAYHDELLSLLRLPPQQDRDAVIVLHMGGTYGDKKATLSRFTHNYKTRLTPSIRARLALENDDVSWSVHDLLPVCEVLDIPLVLDWHHHNIVFDRTQVREGTLDISQPEIQARIRATWDRKGITQKMHYSEPVAGAVSARDRRKHAARVASLPPCRYDMDLMIEAKDKEQAVFEVMRNFRLPGFERIAEMVPFERVDEEAAAEPQGAAKNGERRRKGKKRKGGSNGEEEENGGGSQAEAEHNRHTKAISSDDFGMGGPQNRVYWPPGMEDWLRPRKREADKARSVREESI